MLFVVIFLGAGFILERENKQIVRQGKSYLCPVQLGSPNAHNPQNNST